MVMSAGQIEYAIQVNTQSLIDARREINELNARIDQGMANSSSQVDGLSASFSKLAGAIGGVIAAGQLNAYVSELTETIDQQSKFAQILGISYEELQKLQLLVGKFGIEADDFNDALIDMTRNLQLAGQNAAPEVTSSLAKMGIAIQDIINLSPDQQFMMIGQAIGELSTQSAKSVAIAELFGEEYTRLIGVFDKSQKEIDDLKKSFEDMGLVISDDTAKGVRELKKNMGEITGVAKGFAAALFAEVLPALIKVSEQALAFIKDGEKMQQIFNGLEVAATALAVVMTSRVIASLATYTASLIASTAAAISATTATGALSAAMAVLGGPVGIIALVATSLAALAIKAAMSGESLGDLADKTDELTESFKNLSDEDISQSIDKNNKSLADLNKELTDLKKVEFSIGDPQAYNDAQDRIEEIRDLIEDISIENNILVKTQFDRESAAKVKQDAENAKQDIVDIFTDKPVEINLEDFVSLVGELEYGALTDREKLESDLADQLDLIQKYAETFPQFAEQAERATFLVRQEYRDKTKELNKKEAQELEARNKKTLAEEETKSARLRAIEAKDIADRERAAARIDSILLDSEKTQSNARELIAINEREAIEEIDRLHNEELISLEQYEAAKAAIISKSAKQLADLRAQQAEREQKEIKDAAAQRKRDAKQRQREQAEQSQKNEEFRSFAGGFEDRSPLEDIAFREQEALDKLAELYAQSTASAEEYYAGINAITAQYAEERQTLIEENQAEFARSAGELLSATGDTFGQLAETIGRSGEEASGAYRALFAISKGFAVAQAGLNFSLALTNALASGPFPANLAAVAATASAGAALVGAVGSAVYSGRQTGGDISMGNQYKVNENGVPEVYSYGNNDYLMATQNASITPLDKFMRQDGGGGGGVNVIINNQVANADVTATQGVTKDEVIILIKETVPGEISNPNSGTSRALKNSTTSGRRLT